MSYTNSVMIWWRWWLWWFRWLWRWWIGFGGGGGGEQERHINIYYIEFCCTFIAFCILYYTDVVVVLLFVLMLSLLGYIVRNPIYFHRRGVQICIDLGRCIVCVTVYYI